MAHGCNNDLKGVARDLGLWQHEVMMSIAYNFDQAPWGQGTRHWQLRESLLTHLDTMQPEQDPLFMALLPYILDDLRRNGDAMEPDIAEQLWQELKSVDCVWKRGTPLSFSKFMGAQVKKKEFLKLWTIRLFQILTWGLFCGNLHQDKFKELAEKKTALFWKKLTPDCYDTDSTPLSAKEKEKEAKLKAVCKSGLQTSCMLLLDYENKIRQRILYCLGIPLAEFHGDMSKTTRSCKESQEFLRDCACSDKLHNVCVSTMYLGVRGLALGLLRHGAARAKRR